MNTTIITDRHWTIASELPRVEGFVAYCEARENGYSHIYAMSAAWTAIHNASK